MVGQFNLNDLAISYVLHSMHPKSIGHITTKSTRYVSRVSGAIHSKWPSDFRCNLVCMAQKYWEGLSQVDLISIKVIGQGRSRST